MHGLYATPLYVPLCAIERGLTMGDKEAIQGLVKKIKSVIPRVVNPEPEAPAELIEEIGATFERELELMRLGELAVAEVEEQERQKRQ